MRAIRKLSWVIEELKDSCPRERECYLAELGYKQARIIASKLHLWRAYGYLHEREDYFGVERAFAWDKCQAGRFPCSH